MRRLIVRCVHRPRGRPARARVRARPVHDGRARRHHHRGAAPQGRTPGAARLARARGAAVRLLPAGADHGGRGAVAHHAEAHGRRDRHGNERTHLPLRHLSTHSRGDQGGGGENVMTERREFIQLLGVGGLVIAAGPAGIRRLGAAERLAARFAEPWSPVAYVIVHDDGILTIICHRSEMGQGIRTTMPMIIADEMEADWDKCRVQQAEGNEKKYGSQNTDGSTSIRDFLPQYREAGATVRALLEDAAAKQWGVASREVRAQKHTVVHAATRRTATFASLVASAATLPMPPKDRVRIKSAVERRWQGKKMPSIDIVPLTTGTAVFGADVILPGMKTAVIARPPVWGGKVVSVDDSAALRVSG